MAKRGIGLDIGTSAVKLVEVEGTPQAVRISRFGTTLLPEGSLNSGVVANIGAVSQAISEIFQKSKITGKNVAVAIAGQAVIVRNIKMPDMPKEELDSAVRWESEKYLPFPSDEITLDYQIINRDPENQELEIMLVCAHNSIINSHLETLTQANLQPVAIDIQPFALMRAVGLENSKHPNSIALLDIGAGTSDLTVIKNGVPRFTRIIPLAGQRLTESVQRNLASTFEEAEQLKITHSDALFDLAQSDPASIQFKVNFAIQEILRELVVELRRSFDYYHMQQRNEELNQLIIAGGGAKMTNLIPFLNRELGVTVMAAQAANNLLTPDQNSQTRIHEILPMLMVAYGLALREVIPDAS